MKKTKPIALLLLIIITSCKKDLSHSSFLINGTIKNAPESSMVFMVIEKEKALDSTSIINGKFQFKGSIDKPKKVTLYFKDTRYNKTFWLENNTIEIIGEKYDFSNSKITGSKTQKEADLLLARKDSIYKEMRRIEEMVTQENRDSLYNIYLKMEDVEAKINLNFIKDYPNSYESLYALNISKYKLGSSETAKVFAMMNKQMQETEEGKSITNFIQHNKDIKIGDKYADFEQTNP